MAVFYLDSSAVLKRYRTEKGTDVVDALYESVPERKPYKDIMEALRESLQERRLATSHFTCLEVESVAARTLKGKSLIDHAYSTLLGSFAHDLQQYVEVQSFDGDTLNYSIEITRRARLRPADSIQLASALRSVREGEELVLVASDKELLAAAEGAGIKTLNPEADDAMEVLKKTE
ncbi:MAG: type II toxin-antitoxin system VapC family toxin [Vicinamibacterales bacterium]